MIFLTGGTGYLGSYALHRLLESYDDRIALLVRAKDASEAEKKLWNGLQMHMDAPTFRRHLGRIHFVRGDLTAPDLGIAPGTRAELVRSATSVLHIAASLNRKSEKACLNSNLRGTLSVVKLARAIADTGRLRRFTHVSTVAVAGTRSAEVVEEDLAIDWDRSDYDPYARTKKFCEHMVRELLPDVSKVFLRPSIVMGDSRFPSTTQFDMVRSFCVLADMPFLPMSGAGRLDIVNADFVGDAIATIHQKARPAHEIYHLSSGRQSRTASEVGEALLSKIPGRKPPIFVPRAAGAFGFTADRLASLPKSQLSLIGSLFKVFWPYITYDTVFANERVVAELGREPVPFTAYCGDLYRWAKAQDFQFPYVPLPDAGSAKETTSWA